MTNGRFYCVAVRYFYTFLPSAAF